MSSAHQEPDYMKIFFALTVLTAVEVGIIYLPIGKLAIAIALILLALGKAALVALYFMHLRFEKVGVGIIALTPLFLCTLLIFSLLPDLLGMAHKKQHDQAEKPASSVEQGFNH